ncbi:MAG: DHH family phosphoesterase [Flavobacteriaceae bacterium]
MKNNFIPALKEQLSNRKKIVIIPHKNPDGDALGSCLGLMHFLDLMNHSCWVISPNEYPEFLEWIPGQEQIIIYNKSEEESEKLLLEADLIFTLDFNSLNRIKPMDEVIENCKAIKVMIDHHEQPDDYADLMYSDPSLGSTCEMVYNLMEAIDVSLINKTIATCIYTGIMTDSGSFRFQTTTAVTHSIVSNLLDMGIDHTQIHNNIYDTYSFGRLQLLGKALTNMVKVEPLNAVYITLSQEELTQCDFKKGDTEGFVNFGLSLDGIKLAIILIENTQEKIIKMSFRSKGEFNVNEFARKHFNGGGHHNAAGGVSHENLEMTTQKVHQTILQYKDQLT